MSGHVLTLLENEPYPYDARVRQEAQALVTAGYAVTVASPAGLGFDAPEEHVDRVRVLRYPAPPSGAGFAGYAREYAVSIWALHRLARRVARERPVDVVIVVAAPDLSVLPALPLRRQGAGIVVDHHDPSPELFERKFGDRPAARRALLAIERLALRRADVVLAVNDTCAALARGRDGVPPDRVFTVRQGPDPQRMHAVPERPELRRGRASLVVWTGMLTQLSRVEPLLDAAAELVHRRGVGTVAFALVGPGEALDAAREAVRRRELEDVVELPGRVDDELLRAYVSTADVCVSVDEHGPMNDLATVTKVLDYMAVGRPVLQFPLAEMLRVCGEATAYYDGAAGAGLADALLGLLEDPRRREELGRAGRERVADGLLWPAQVPVFLDAVRTAQEAGRRRRGRG